MSADPPATEPARTGLRARAAAWAGACLERAKMQDHFFMVGGAIIIGILCGFGAVGFRYMVDGFHWIFWGEGELPVMHLKDMPAWKVVGIPALGGLIVGPIIYFFAREAKGHGVPEVMLAVTTNNGIIRSRVALAKAVASAFTISSGGSAGREGPIIQIGSAIGSTFGQILKVSRRKLRTFVGCGAAAGIAATFNAPIAGALFAVEIILGEFGVAQFSPIVISSVLATVIARHYFGSGPVFEAPEYEMASMFELGPFVLLGILCGLASYAFIKILYFFEDSADRVRIIPDYLKPFAGGLLLGCLGLIAPLVYGDGYTAINMALHNQLPWMVLAFLLLAKILATSLTLGSGGSGGVFAPSLFMGATAGGLLGHAVVGIMGDAAGAVGGYALVGMGGVVAGTTHAPITAILMIFEITNDYRIILPLMTVCILSTLISTRISGESIYTLKLMRRGISLFGSTTLDLLKNYKVERCITRDIEKVDSELPAVDLMDRMLLTEKSQFYAVDRQNHLAGVILLEDLGKLVTNRQGLEHIMLAEDLTNEGVPRLAPTETLSQAFLKFERSGLPELPVIENDRTRQLLGALRYTDVVSTYNQEVLRRDTAETLAQHMHSSGAAPRVKVTEGVSIMEWDPPQNLWGKTLFEASLPSHYRVRVILVKRREPDTSGLQIVPEMPGRDYRIQEHDTLIIYGRDEDLDRIARL